MITNLFYMSGYGTYVWSAFIFTFFSFSILYLVIRVQYVREKNKFISKFGALDPKKAEIAKSQNINREILSTNQNY
ncbi:heme exporter protein CcmD [Candidatus Pelagibacter sp.]|nr:heme exporter protein CcmD [Candidatus Pelagibacter sp.]|tara:strand:+ start:1241 stop:1468 length:228 start_codon:yes stop_codon:yes gene_type:complete